MLYAASKNISKQYTTASKNIKQHKQEIRHNTANDNEGFSDSDTIPKHQIYAESMYRTPAKATSNPKGRLLCMTHQHRGKPGNLLLSRLPRKSKYTFM